MDKLHEIEHTLQRLRSPKRSYTFWGLLLFLAVCFGLLWLKHGHWLKTANEHMLTISPDGIKNYMTTIWHVRYDSNFVHYEGMNYPFGEHVLFTDNQPIFSSALQWWSQNVSDLTGHTVGLLNISQIISLLVGCGVLFLLFRKLHVPTWYSGLAALGILFLSPQYLRFGGHFSLSHTWVIPMLLLLLCNYEERYSRRYQSLLIGILLWWTAQLHFYYFGLCSLFLIVYTIYQLVRDSTLRNWRVRISHLIVMIVLPFALLNGWVHWADFAADRPANPYGFTTYIGEWAGIFLPYENLPVYKWIDQNLVSIPRVNGESEAYIGVVALFFTIWVLVSRFRIFDKSWEEAAYHRVHKRYLYGIFTAALVLLLFACGFPFAIGRFEWMVDYMGPLRQFRGLGRFTWAFYYVINLLAFYSLWNWSVRFKGFKNGKAPWFRWVIALAPMLILGLEAWTFQRSRVVSGIPNLELLKNAAPAPDHWLHKVDFSPYQAVLPLPYYHMGSENIWWEFDYDQFKRNQATVLHTGLPDMGVNLSRTSCSQTVISVQFVLEPCKVPAMLNELPDNRPLAILVDGKAWEDVQRRYPHLVSKARPVYDSPEMKILSVTPDDIREYVREHLESVEQEYRSRPLQNWGAWQVPEAPALPLIYVSYDSLRTTENTFQGGGAYTGQMRDSTWLWRDALPKGRYVLSCWLYANQDMGMNNVLELEEKDLQDGRQIQARTEALGFKMKSIVKGWALVELPIEVQGEQSELRIFLKQNADQTFFLDELLIRPENLDVYRRDENWVVRNNYWYKL